MDDVYMSRLLSSSRFLSSMMSDPNFQDNVVTSMEQWKVVESFNRCYYQARRRLKAGAWALRFIWQVLCVLCLRTPRGARPTWEG